MAIGSAMKGLTKTGSGAVGSAWAGLKGNRMWLGVNLWAGTSGYRMARDQGSGVGGSLARGVTNALLIDFVGAPLYFAGMAATGIPKAAVRGYESVTHRQRELGRFSLNRPFQHANFVDHEQVYTMRQAGMAMGQRSGMGVQQAMLGGEAAHYHR